jgi:hypothetical protein
MRNQRLNLIWQHLKFLRIRNEVERIKNGKLVALCVENGFDIILTIDKNLMCQQSLDNYELPIAVLNHLPARLKSLSCFYPHLHRRLTHSKNIRLTSLNGEEKGNLHFCHYLTNNLSHIYR